MRILIIGATGMLGKPVTTQLIESGFDVTILVRDTAKADALFPFAKTLRGDVFDRSTLVRAFDQMDAVYMNLSVHQSSKEKDPQPEREGVDNIISAAKETGIKRLVYLSSLVHFYEGMNGFHWWSFRLKQSAVEKIKASGIAYTIFYPSTFMETIPYQMMQGNKVGLLGRSEMPMWFIAAADYAKQVARSFEIAGHENKEYTIQGLEALRSDEAAKIFIANYKKKKLSTLKAPMWIVKFMGIFIQKFNYGWHICEALNKYPEKMDSQQTWNELGKPVTRLADYARSLVIPT
jgi:uncharacterized protein YbjT (DUF2867 family)